MLSLIPYPLLLFQTLWWTCFLPSLLTLAIPRGVFAPKNAKAAKSKEGEKKRKLSFPSLSSIQEPIDHQQFVTVNGEKIFLDSSNSELAATARMLVDHFSNRLPIYSCPSNIKYSRTDLLTLATSPLGGSS
jgi:hypothetical protein